MEWDGKGRGGGWGDQIARDIGRQAVGYVFYDTARWQNLIIVLSGDCILHSAARVHSI